jgi:hypothetical protein
MGIERRRSRFGGRRSKIIVRRLTFDVRRWGLKRSTFEVGRSGIIVRRSTFEVRGSGIVRDSGMAIRTFHSNSLLFLFQKPRTPNLHHPSHALHSLLLLPRTSNVERRTPYSWSAEPRASNVEPRTCGFAVRNQSSSDEPACAAKIMSVTSRTAPSPPLRRQT